MPRESQYDSDFDEVDPDFEEHPELLNLYSKPRVPRISPVYQEKFRQIESILDQGIGIYWEDSPDGHLVIKLNLPDRMLRNIRSVRIRVDDPEHWAVLRYNGKLRSAISGEENCEGLDALKWALSGVLNLYYLAADDSIAAHPLHKQKSEIRPVRAIPTPWDEVWESSNRYGHPVTDGGRTPSIVSRSGQRRPRGSARAI